MKKRLFIVLSAFIIVGLTFGVSYLYKTSAIVPGTNYLVNKDASGTWANSSSLSWLHSLSGDGRYVVFTSSASNLVTGDTNGKTDVFLKDTQTGMVTLIDVDSTGTVAPNGASFPAISYDGRYVVFRSTDDLVSGVTGANIYRRDLINNTTTVVSQNASGTSLAGTTPDINADGRYVTFVTPQNNGFGTVNSVVIKDMQTGAFQTLALGLYDSTVPSIDCDGHVVAYISHANLGGNTPYNSDKPHFYYNYYYSNVDWSTNSRTYIENINDTNAPEYPPQVSCNGNIIQTSAERYNRLSAQLATVNPVDNGVSTNQRFTTSDDGRYIAFTSRGTNLDTSHSSTSRGTYQDVFVKDTKTGIIQLVSFTVSGYMSGLVYPGYVSISPDGSTIAYAYYTPASTNGSELISSVDTGHIDVYTSKTGF